MFFLFILFLFFNDIFAKELCFLEQGDYQMHFIEKYRALRPEYFANELSRVKIDYDKSSSAFPLLELGYDHSKIVIYKVLNEQKNSFISFIRDDKGNRYVVKQEKVTSLKKQLQSVCEILSAFMAEKVGISAHYVRILPIGTSFPGKKIVDQTATVHTFMPGITIRNLASGPYEKLNIKLKNDLSVALPVSQMGLSRDVIANMALHPSLPPIVALDTFIGNRDRNRGNLLYDEKKNSFYAIDMALIYDTYSGKTLIAQLLCEQIACMIKDKESFNEKEVVALRSYQKTLQALVTYFTPKKIYTLMHKFAFDAGLKENTIFNSMDVFDAIYEYKCKIKETEVYINRIIDLLSILLR